MEKNFLKTIFNKKTQDYSFVILFFLVFSAFIIFAISPSLRTAFSLKKEESDLTKVDNLYEQKIMNISEIQNQIEEHRDDLPLLNQAVSQYPEVNKMFDDVKTAADKNSFIITKANIAEVNLRQTTKKIDRLKLNIEGKSSFENITALINELFSQRRLKMISNLVISRDIESTSSSQLNVIMTVEGYYL